MPEISVYSAFKAGLDHATRVLEAEYGPKGVRVNAVAPGFTATEMTKDMDRDFVKSWEELSLFGRIGQPEEVASVVTFLASEDAGWVTGKNRPGWRRGYDVRRARANSACSRTSKLLRALLAAEPGCFV